MLHWCEHNHSFHLNLDTSSLPDYKNSSANAEKNTMKRNLCSRK